MNSFKFENGDISKDMDLLKFNKIVLPEFDENVYLSFEYDRGKIEVLKKTEFGKYDYMVILTIDEDIKYVGVDFIQLSKLLKELKIILKD